MLPARTPPDGLLHDMPDDRLNGVLAPQPGRSTPEPTRVVLEVGCGFGDAAVTYAALNPDVHVVATDVYLPGLAAAAAQADDMGLRNLWLAAGDAVPLLERVAPGRLCAIHLFFPDPWPKAKHHKRRWVSAHTLTVCDRALAPGGVVRVATDHAPYADRVRRQTLRHGTFEVADVARPSWRPLSGFEAKARSAGRSVSELELRRRLPDQPSGGRT